MRYIESFSRGGKPQRDSSTIFPRSKSLIIDSVSIFLTLPVKSMSTPSITPTGLAVITFADAIFILLLYSPVFAKLVDNLVSIFERIILAHSIADLIIFLSITLFSFINTLFKLLSIIFFEDENLYHEQ